MKNPPVIEIDHLYKSFGENTVLKDFSIKLYQGENIAILGKSGSGKSVLIKCIINLIEADKGKVTILGSDIDYLGQEEMDKIRARVGFLFQSNALYDSMTVRENLEFPLRRHWTREQREKGAKIAVMKALEDVGLAHTIDMMPSELSGGMRKRIALARALILHPDIILYDEPTTGLDPITSREISELIVEVRKKYNTSSIIISHDISCIKTTADKVVMLIDGENYMCDTFEKIKTSQDPKVKMFFNEN